MIIWLASYPKSGNTWIRSFFTAYLADGPVNINKLRFPVASSRKMLDRQLGRSTAALPPGQVRALRPEAYRRLSAAADKRGVPQIVKVHDTWELTPKQVPLFPPEITHGVVYVVRHPLDVAVSFAHHLGIPVDRAADNLCEERYILSIGDPNERNQVPQFLRSWKTHVASWLDQGQVAVHLVKYEEMHRAPVQTFGGILDAMGFPVDAARLQRAIAAVSLPQLQTQELLHGFKEKGKKSDRPFFRQGKVGTWVKELSPDSAEKIRRYNGAMMQRLGYV